MAIKKLNPYLNYDGNAAKAIALYERVLGAKVEGLQRFGDMPGPGGKPPAPETKDRVMHAVLHIGEGLVMVSDGMPGKPPTLGSNVHITLDFDDEADMAQKFDGLAAGGKIEMPLQDTFWGARFGMLTDPFGINWMFNCQKKPA
jgi:PhnB protein